jgi:RNA polymerase sigma factor (TIGR02999 family)
MKVAAGFEGLDGAYRLAVGMSTGDAVNQSPADLDTGDARAVSRSLPVLYAELRRLADQLLVNERRGHTLQPTALVHEALLKLLGQPSLRFDNLPMFFSIAARAMRQALVDSARRFGTTKRGGGQRVYSLDEVSTVFTEPNVDLVALDEALKRLAEFDPRQGAIVELRFFGGLTIEQTAQVLDISATTVKREWQSARAWLFGELRQGHSESL